MKRKHSLGRWCGLGLAVAAVAGGAYAGKRYAEQHMLATVLGTGVRAEAVSWHWRQAAGCAEQVEIPLPYAKDSHDQALQLYAPKLWFVYDQSALLRKRFILPRVVIEDAVISTSSDHMLDQQMVDIDFGIDGSGVDLDNLVELPTSDPSSIEFQAASSDSGPTADAASTSSNQRLVRQVKSTGMSLEWLDQLQATSEAMLSDKTILGQQVSVDVGMLSESLEAEFGDNRLQAQKLLSDARQLHQQLVDMDNVLRQPQLNEISRHLDFIADELKKLKADLVRSDKRLDEQQSRLRSALLIEKKQLLRQADEYKAQPAPAVAQAILAHMVSDRVKQPTRAMVLLADLMRKPLDSMASSRGQQLRYLDQEQAEFAARSARISGKVDMGGKAWPFKAQGKFEVSTAAAEDDSVHNEVDSRQGMPVGSSQWQMTIDAEAGSWQIDGQCPSVEAPCSVAFTSSSSDSLSLTCQVAQSRVSGHGQIGLRQVLGADGVVPEMIDAFAAKYRAEEWLRRFMAEALAVDDQTPDLLTFEATELESASECQLNKTAVTWLSTRLQSIATAAMADTCRQSAARLETLVNARLTDQKGMAATLRKDAEQYLGAQQDELRRIQTSVNSLIQQRQANYYFARQPGEPPR